MDEFLICGMQQVGVGVPNLEDAARWYRRVFGTDIRIFEDDGVASLMGTYTGGVPQHRKAQLAVNLQGGAGLEIWQYKSRAPRSAEFEVRPGDLGICRTRIKARNPADSHARMVGAGIEGLGELRIDPSGSPSFILRDPMGFMHQIVEGQEWFTSGSSLTGGVSGCMIGVSRMDESIEFYRKVLGYDTIIYDVEGSSSDLEESFDAPRRLRRVLLGRRAPSSGAFGPLLGTSRIELVQAVNHAPRRIFSNRFWGDLGYIHVCFDVRGMDALKRHCGSCGFPFRIDSGEAFLMGEASGRFAYVEDPDGTLIEFVETYQLPLVKKLGLKIDLRRRPASKPLSRWLLRALAFNRIRD
jgi:catechol 2,3-dioxygenase-like lactoylglutathione lyase family enzyme